MAFGDGVLCVEGFLVVSKKGTPFRCEHRVEPWNESGFLLGESLLT
jgi:hypothetical protein